MIGRRHGFAWAAAAFALLGWWMPHVAAAQSGIELTSSAGIEARTAALLLSGRRGGDVAGDVLWTTLDRDGGGQWPVPYFLELDGQTLLADNPGTELDLEIHLYVLDGEGGVVLHVAQNARIGDKEQVEAVRSFGIKLVGRLFLDPGRHVLRVVVRNRATDRFFLDGSVIDVDASRSTEPHLLPPLFGDLFEGWVEVGLQGIGQANMSLELAGEQIVPAALPALIVGQPSQFFLVGRAWPEEARVVAEIVDPQGRVAPVDRLDLSRSQRTPSGELLVRKGSMVPPDLHPGIYDLAISLFDTDARLIVSRTVPVAVVPDVAADVVAADAGPTRSARALAMEIGRSEARAAYVESLVRLSRGDGVGARQVLDELESGTLAGGSAKELRRLGQLERATAQDLHGRIAESIVPVVMLHHDAYRGYLLRSDYLLETHAWQLVADLAELAGKGAAGRGDFTVGVLISLAGLLLSNEDVDSASEVLERALAVDPTNEAALMTLGAIHERKGRYDQAVKALRRLLESHPGNWEGRLRLALNLHRVGQTETAVESLRQITSACPVPWICAVAHQELARILVMSHQPREAETVLVAGASKLPSNQRLVLQRAFLLERLGRPYEADALLGEIEPDSDPRSTSARWRYGLWPDIGIESMRQRLAGAAAAAQPALDEVLQTLIPHEEQQQ